MHVDAALREFAGDSRAQAAAQDRVLAARAEWQGRPQVARVLADCRTLRNTGDFARCGALLPLIDEDGAQEFVARFIAAMLAAWRDQPLAQLPFRHSYAGGQGIVHIHRGGPVTLALVLVEPDTARAPRTIAFSDCDRREVVLTGQAAAVRYTRRDGAPPVAQEVRLAPGTVLTADADNSRAIAALDAPLVLLRVAREPAHPRPTLEVELETGRIVHRASPSPADGRAELAAALLGAMGRTDAAPALAGYACGEGGCGQAGEGARWQALRHALALDTASGFASLCAIAERDSDPLAREATALRHRLCTTYPQLAKVRESQCLAS
ncbi:hypothetical protein KYN89_04260 [Alteriqipengyuania sp. NZ-12B]|uniref:Uncharacterized protein n=1 Tax=Alteriqipengyuania abyssalis TaxID=2860200 RepID=A0ABS7PC01_9SPHN|nr:hypothetical protein [Alteriqipengyuania abyssalis]MBY8336252.1 hypothetical protein [Alteriqipengyuania abyssalis]